MLIKIHSHTKYPPLKNKSKYSKWQIKYSVVFGDSSNVQDGLRVEHVSIKYRCYGATQQHCYPFQNSPTESKVLVQNVFVLQADGFLFSRTSDAETHDVAVLVNTLEECSLMSRHNWTKMRPQSHKSSVKISNTVIQSSYRASHNQLFTRMCVCVCVFCGYD